MNWMYDGNHQDCCSDFAKSLASHLVHPTLATLGDIETWILTDEKSPFNKPIWWYNAEVHASYKPQINEFVKGQLAKAGFSIREGMESTVVEMFARKDWMIPVCDIVSEKFDRGTKLQLREV